MLAASASKKEKNTFPALDLIACTCGQENFTEYLHSSCCLTILLSYFILPLYLEEMLVEEENISNYFIHISYFPIFLFPPYSVFL